MSYKKHDIDAEAQAIIHDMAEKAEALEIEVEAYTKAATQYIKKNPLKSTAFAALAGIFLGKLLGR